MWTCQCVSRLYMSGLWLAFSIPSSVQKKKKKKILLIYIVKKWIGAIVSFHSIILINRTVQKGRKIANSRKVDWRNTFSSNYIHQDIVPISFFTVYLNILSANNLYLFFFLAWWYSKCYWNWYAIYLNTVVLFIYDVSLDTKLLSAIHLWKEFELKLSLNAVIL